MVGRPSYCDWPVSWLCEAECVDVITCPSGDGIGGDTIDQKVAGIDARNRFSKFDRDIRKIKDPSCGRTDTAQPWRDGADIRDKGIQLRVPAEIAAGGGRIVEGVNGKHIRPLD